MTKIKELLGCFRQYFAFGEAPDNWEVGFRCGAFTAISTILFIIVLFALLRLLFFRKRQLRQLEIDGEKGKYIIATAAVADLLASRMAVFQDITLLKTKVFPGRNKKCQIIMYVNYRPVEDAENLQSLISKLQDTALEALANVFGVTTVESVSVCVTRANGKK